VCVCVCVCVRVWHATLLITAEWRRPIGCLKSQVIFHKRATNIRALLRKMTYKDKASYASDKDADDALSL